jgi:hypothetical protein
MVSMTNTYLRLPNGKEMIGLVDERSIWDIDNPTTYAKGKVAVMNVVVLRFQLIVVSQTWYSIVSNAVPFLWPEEPQYRICRDRHG